MGGRILIVDDDRSLCELIASLLTRRGFEARWSVTAEQALDLLRTEDFAVVVTDLVLTGSNGLELCERISTSYANVPVIIVTAHGDFERAVGAIRAGAYDFMIKPLELDRLQLAIERALQHRALREEVKRLQNMVASVRPCRELIGSSPALSKVCDTLERVAATDTSVLITGESGTGKELAARTLHQRSKRRGGPFIAINCAAMPETLLESELFGHARGAFTDAKVTRTGLFVQANGGTLLLDEIGELSLGLQPKLLRALEEKKVRPVGSDTDVSFDARVIAATNRDLELDVEERRFREDLYYRINVIHVVLPPLRARGNDVLLLAQAFVQRYAQTFGKKVTGLSAAAGEKLLAYDWPGNVRELQNCIERAVALTHFQELVVDDLPEKIQAFRRSRVALLGDDPPELVPLEEVERRYILRVLELLGGNKVLAAQTLGLDRKTLYRKLHQYGVLSSGKGSS